MEYFSLALERAVLGKFLLYGDSFELDLVTCEPTWFAGPHHADIILAMQRCLNKERSSLLLYTVEELAPIWDRDKSETYLRTACMQADGVKQSGIQEDITQLQLLYNQRRVHNEALNLQAGVVEATDTESLLGLVESTMAGVHRQLTGIYSKTLDPKTG